MPCPQTLTEIIKQPATVKNICVREIVFTMASYNIGAVAEKSYTNGVIGFDGKVYMLVDEFEKEKLQIVGLQECRSKDGGTSQIESYHRVIPDVKGPAAGDVDFLFNTVIVRSHFRFKRRVAVVWAPRRL